MNETQNPPQATVENPITLPQGVNYDDLNKAHQADQEDGGSREEEMYPTAQSQIDNANVYRDEMAKVMTPDAAQDLRSRLEPDPKNEGRVEIDDRTGNNTFLKESLNKRLDKREEGFAEQDATFVEYLENHIPNISDFDGIDTWIRIADGNRDREVIRPEQHSAIIVAIEEKRIQLQDESFQSYLDKYIPGIAEFDGIDTWIRIANGNRDRGVIRPAQHDKIIQLIEEKRIQLQNESFQKYLDKYIPGIADFDGIDTWIRIADGNRDREYIRPEQHSAIIVAIEEKRIQLQDESFQSYLDKYVPGIQDFDAIDSWIRIANGNRDRGVIRPAQHDKVIQLIEARRTELQDAQANKYLTDYIPNSSNQTVLEQWERIANGNATRGYIRPEHMSQIKQAVIDKTLEFGDGIN